MLVKGVMDSDPQTVSSVSLGFEMLPMFVTPVPKILLASTVSARATACTKMTVIKRPEIAKVLNVTRDGVTYPSAKLPAATRRLGQAVHTSATVRRKTRVHLSMVFAVVTSALLAGQAPDARMNYRS